MPSDTHSSVRQHVLALLRGGNAHLSFERGVKDFPAALRGVKPTGAPHSAWQLLEHLRLAQRDILDFSRDATHQSPPWPEGYWPGAVAPGSDADWNRSVEQFGADGEAFCALVEDPGTDLLRPLPKAPEGQTLLREALILADHNSYHLGQLVYLRKLLEGAAGA